ncbi:hypothetical protein [Veillonella caviae]|nr:hypothetical protein [Veillonella caviae]MDY5254320.1 hypothetical protein [Veillonella caviae]MDY5408671.1 hypothetical protein [Veillonella caviae]MDY5715932.1 hypothetical protein [Veillonella caviae]
MKSAHSLKGLASRRTVSSERKIFRAVQRQWDIHSNFLSDKVI